MKEKFDSYDFLNDNGFFNAPVQSSNVLVETKTSNELMLPEKDSKDYLAILRKIEEKVESFAPIIKGAIEASVGAFFMDAGFILLAYSFILAAIVTIIFGVVNDDPDDSCKKIKLSKILYKLKKHIKINQTFYTLNYNLEIKQVTLKGLYYDNHQQMMFECESDQRLVSLCENEIFPTVEAAEQAANDIRFRRWSALSPILGNKTDAFLNSDMLYKYAKEYAKYNISVWDFLTSEDSFCAFCEFVKYEKNYEMAATQKRDTEKQNAQNTINDVMALI